MKNHPHARPRIHNVLDKQFRRDPTETACPYFNPFIGADPLGRRFHVSMQSEF